MMNALDEQYLRERRADLMAEGARERQFRALADQQAKGFGQAFHGLRHAFGQAARWAQALGVGVLALVFAR